MHEAAAVPHGTSDSEKFPLTLPLVLEICNLTRSYPYLPNLPTYLWQLVQGHMLQCWEEMCHSSQQLGRWKHVPYLRSRDGHAYHPLFVWLECSIGPSPHVLNGWVTQTICCRCCGWPNSEGNLLGSIPVAAKVEWNNSVSFCCVRGWLSSVRNSGPSSMPLQTR